MGSLVCPARGKLRGGATEQGAKRAQESLRWVFLLHRRAWIRRLQAKCTGFRAESSDFDDGSGQRSSSELPESCRHVASILHSQQPSRTSAREIPRRKGLAYWGTASSSLQSLGLKPPRGATVMQYRGFSSRSPWDFGQASQTIEVRPTILLRCPAAGKAPSAFLLLSMIVHV